MNSVHDSVVDVAVIGGGPAGAAAARCLASWGHTVMVLSRGVSGPASAESVPPSCLALFDRIGIRHAVESAGFVRATGNTVWWSGATRPSRVMGFGADSMGFQVDRHEFDRLLLREAAAAGAVIRDHALVREVVRGREADEQTHLRFVDGTDARDIRARWVLDCTGRAGLLARHGWRRPVPGTRTIGLVGVWNVRSGWGLDDASHTLVKSYEHGWAWSVPDSSRRRCFIVMVDPAIASLKGRGRVEAQYREELASTTHLKRFVQRATLAGPPWARDASPYTSARVGDDGLLLVGDAASFVDPLSSFGVKKALASAWLASVVVHTALSDRGMLPHALALYERQERTTFERLSERSAELAREAAGGTPTSFSNARAMADTGDGEDSHAISALCQDPAVASAYEELGRRHVIQLRSEEGVHEVLRPVVRGNVVVLEKRLASRGFPDGMQCLHDVDLCVLASLASGHQSVTDLCETYGRVAGPVSRPEFLDALSVLVGKQFLSLA